MSGRVVIGNVESLTLLKFTTMKKIHSLILAFIAGVGLCANATQRTVGQFSFDDAYTLSNAMCILDDTTVWYQIAVDNPSSAFIRWGAAGEIETKNGNSSSILVRSKGPAKGRVYYYYNQGDCGSQAYGLDIYKHFNPNTSPYNLVIEGPDCVGDSETVVFSVEPILTKNINSGIGIDTYSWRFISQAGTTYVDSVSYKSGDGSAITFTTGRLTGNEQIAVQVGRANEQYIIVKDLGRAAPRPDVPTDTCVASGDKQTIRIEVRNSSDSLEYTWTAPTTWDINRVSKNGSVVEIEANGKDGGTVTVMAAFKSNSGTCGSASRSVININRSWASGIDITPKTTCSFNGDSALTFVLDKDKLPSTDNITWEIPTTWSQKENKGLHSATLEAFPLSSTNYIDTLRVWTDNCGGNEQFAYVHIAPAKAAPVSNQGCLIAGQTDTFSITTMGVGPQAMSYTWFVDGNVVRQTGTDTLIQTLTANNHYVAVRANGKNGCNADSVQIALSFKPATPDSIIFREEHCITYNMPDTLTFSVYNPVPYQKYEWTAPNGWTVLDYIGNQNLDTCVRMISNGVTGTHTLYVKGVNEQSEECRMSDSISAFVIIDTTLTVINYYGEDLDGRFDLTPRRPGTTYYWYMLYNGYIVADGLDYDDGRINALSDTFMDNIGYEIQDLFTIVVEYISNGCRYRIIYGVSIPSNFTPLGITTIQDIIGQTQYSSPSRKFATKTTDIKPIAILSPNPTMNTLNLSLNSEENFAFKIFSSSGQLIYSEMEEMSSWTIDVSDFPNEEYLVVIMQNGKRLTVQKFIKY